jgi:hypothetical protein
MKHILVAWKQPDQKHFDAVQRWTAALHDVRKLATPSASNAEIADGVFLFDASSGLPNLGRSLAIADREKISYRVLFIDSATEWKHEPPK